MKQVRVNSDYEEGIKEGQKKKNSDPVNFMKKVHKN